VTVASLASFAGGGGKAVPYTVSKHGVVGLTQIAAVQAAPLGVRINAVAPGFTATEMMQLDRAEPAFRDRVTGTIPLGRFARPADIANATAFLLSDDAAYITGVTIPIDGGVEAVGSLGGPYTAMQAFAD
jgi:NAD(P)-dependent dehydrogenase (short-subunit alcohol dehydrogenase family)